jgi:hypothetical protein
MWQLAWLAAFGLSLGALAFAGGPHCERRPHFWLRALSVALIPAAVVSIAPVFLPLLVLFAVPTMMLLPALLYRSWDPPPGSDDDGRGPDPDPPPPSTPPAPRGGIPLEDAEQSRARMRDHSRPRLREPGVRRPVREPERTLLRR